MLRTLHIVLPALLVPLVLPARAAAMPTAARTEDTVVTCAFTVTTLRGTINRAVYPYRGTLALRGKVALPGLLTLQAFTNTAQTSLLTLNDGKTLGSGAFVRSNKAGTVLTFRSRIRQDKWLLTTTLRLKKRVLQVSMTVRNEPDLDHGLGTANQDTDGWLPHTVAASVCLHDDDLTLFCVGTFPLREKSQMDKKTVYK